MNLRKYSSIEQFRNVIKDVDFYCKSKYGLRDETDELILAQPRTWKLPTLKFKGTVKLHGTNASIRVDYNKNVTYQSRNRILTIDSDNAGFALWASQYVNIWKSIATFYSLQYLKSVEVVLFGEWCGGNIQKGVALSQLEKMFVIFEVWVYDSEGVKRYAVQDAYQSDPSVGIYDINHFETFNIDIDFENPQLSQNKLIEITEAVEKECPVGKHFGVSGVGEGVVWTCDLNETSRLRFKVKGEEHSASKVKTLASVDVEKITAVSDFADSVLTESRLEQGIDYLKEMGHELSVKSTGHYVKWVSGDVFKEETDTIVANQLDTGMVGKHVSTKARQWFMQRVMTET